MGVILLTNTILTKRFQFAIKKQFLYSSREISVKWCFLFDIGYHNGSLAIFFAYSLGNMGGKFGSRMIGNRPVGNSGW